MDGWIDRWMDRWINDMMDDKLTSFYESIAYTKGILEIKM